MVVTIVMGENLRQLTKSSYESWIVSDPTPSSDVEPGWSTN